MASLLFCCALLPAQTLRDLADQRGIRIGAATDPSHFSEAAYASTLAREFNQAEPENAMKFGPIHPGVNTYNFASPDSIVSFARANHMAVRGHTLVWYNQNPGWLTSGNYKPEQLNAILEDHIQNVVGHYAGQVYAWDVVNEAFNGDGSLRSYLWSDAPGIGLAGAAYIAQAFQWAHAADPAALLFYNDYGAEGINAKSDAIYKMAQDFRARGVPIGGIGMQMHFTTSTGSLSSIESNIKRITDLGLQVQITELDVRLLVDAAGVATSAQLATQAQIYHDVVALCLKFPLCTGIQTWGFTDKYSWIPGMYAGMGAALEFDASYQAKPSHASMLDAMQTAPPVISATRLTNAASYDNRGVAPGEIVALFDVTFGPASLSVAAVNDGGKLPTQVAETRLLFDGNPAPLLYSEVGRIAAIVPFAVEGQASTQVVYEYRGVRSHAVTVEVVPTAPGVFTLDSSGNGPGAVLDAAYRVNSQANPAGKGDAILLFATGGGVTEPPGVDGQIAIAAPSGVPRAAVSVSIGGIECRVQYVGGAPGLVAGALQLNLEVAAAVPSGAQPVIVTIGNAKSRSEVTVWIR